MGTMSRLPKGCTNVGGNIASAMEKCRELFISSFGAFGYKPFWPSALQLLETAWDRLPESIRTRLMTISTPFGEPCCLRADITLAAVAYLSAHHSPEERPLRLCYSDRVYKTPQRPETYLESFQIGAELLGWEGEGADIEVLNLLLKTLDKMGLDDTHLVLGDVKIVQKAMETIPSQLAQQLISSLEKGSYSTYFKILEKSSVPQSILPFLKALPDLKGDSQVLARTEILLGSNDCLKSLKEIEKAMRYLGYGNRIRFDLALARELNYYSGPIFDIYSSRLGKPLGGGGRYDGLLFKYGIFGQAIGFALDLESTASISRFKGSSPNTIMVWPGGLSPAEAIIKAESLIDSNIHVEISWSADRKESFQLTRMRDITWWIDLLNDIAINTSNNEEYSMQTWIEESKC